MRSRSRAVVIALLALGPALGSASVVGAEPALAERGGGGRGVGVITTLSGSASVARAALPAPQPLRFKDDVFLRDRISTAEKSIARVLLGGKALVTVRELSTLTITEETGRSTVELTSGKIAMGVLRQRMRPGEVIEIRTPNAIAAIRGTVLVVELTRAPGAAGGAARYTTTVHVLHGLVEVSDPNNPGAPPATVGTLESWSRSGSAPSALIPLSPGAANQIFADLRSAPQIAEGPSELMHAVTVREQARAVAVAEFLAPEISNATGGGDGSEPSAFSATVDADSSSFVRAPMTPNMVAAMTPASGPSSLTPGTAPPGNTPPSPPAGPGGPPSPWPTGKAWRTYDGQTVALRGSLYTLTGGQTDTPVAPMVEALASSLTVGQSLMEVTGGATFTSSDTTSTLGVRTSKLSASSLLSLSGGARLTLSGGLFQDQDGGLDLQSDALRLSGARFTASSAAPVVDLAGTAAHMTGGLLSASGGALLELLNASAPLLALTRNAALTTERNLVDLSGGVSARVGQLASLTASSLAVKGHVLSVTNGARLSVTGDLFRLASGSTLTVTNGALLSLSGGSTLRVAGALVNFIGSGNTLSISNNLCGGACTMVGNLPVLVTGGGSISLTNPIVNLGGNTLAIAPGSAVITVTGGAQVKQGP
jgi:FecR-like protein